jgi:hypothetical protein
VLLVPERLNSDRSGIPGAKLNTKAGQALAEVGFKPQWLPNLADPTSCCSALREAARAERPRQSRRRAI